MIKSITLVFAVALATFNFTSIKENQDLLLLKAATPVSLQLNQQLSSEEVEIGHAVEFLVRSDVVVNGKVVISAGSIAEGWVKDVKKMCQMRNCGSDWCAKLVITVESVQAVDGQRVFLRSIPHTIKGQCCCGGGPAIANIGTVLRANVLNNVKINA